MRNTPIQWCDDTVNPRPGCDGCPLWPTVAQIRNRLSDRLVELAPQLSIAQANKLMRKHLEKYAVASLVYKDRKMLVAGVLEDIGLTDKRNLAIGAVEAIVELFRCYAGQLTLRYGGHTKGYPTLFEQPVLFPGRMAIAAAARDLTGTVRPYKSWLDELARLIFISDMGDLLSKGVSFEFLKREIVDVVSSPKGIWHIWLWLTKRPAVMVRFWKWLRDQGIGWPSNLMPMTSILSQAMVPAAEVLAQIDAPFRGLSVEPLWERVELPLNGIDWVIVGGESGPYAKAFHLEWAREVQAQCAARGIAFFMKQLGQNPYERGQPMKLKHCHGSDWNEWPEDLRVRQFPAAFYGGDQPEMEVKRAA